MGRKEFNELWKILNNMQNYDVSLIPERFMEFVRSSMIPDKEADIDLSVPLEDQDLSEETVNILASLLLTYLAESPGDRREYAETLNRNEDVSREEVPSPMTEEEYQKLLGIFDEWNEMFGPIPFWGESRGWQPEICYELVPKSSEADPASDGRGLVMEDPAPEMTAGGYELRQVYVTEEERARILSEASEWVLVRETKYTETLYWHDDDHSEWSGTKEIGDFYKKSVVIRDGHFFGALISTALTSSMGLSVYRNSEYGVLCTDGSRIGRTEDSFSHSSSEVSKTEDSTYYLRRR